MAAVPIYEEELEPSADPSDMTSQNALTCQSCQTYMKISRQLPCGHVMCLACLKCQTETSRGDKGSFFCPLKECGKFVLVPAAGLEFLPTAGATGALSAIMAEWSVTLPVVPAPEGEICGVCGEGSSKGKKRKKKKSLQLDISHECETCCQYLCGECWEGHVRDAQTDTASACSVVHRHGHGVCCRHGNEAEYYCYDCSLPVCYICDVKNHGQHRKDKLSVLLQDKTTRSRDLLNHFRGHRDADRGLAQQARHLADEQTTAFDLAAEKVKAAATEARKTIDLWEKEQIEVLNQQKAKHLKQVSKVASGYEESCAFLDSLLASCTKLVETDHRLKLSLMCNMNKVLTSLMTTSTSSHQHNEVSQETVGIPLVQFSKTLAPSTYGNVQFGYGVGLDNTTITKTWTWKAGSVCTHASIRQPGDVTFLQDGGLVVGGQLNRTVWLFNLGQGQEPLLLCTGLYPQGINCTPDGGIAVSDGDVRSCVRYFDACHKTQTQVWMPEGVKNPCSVAHFSDGSRAVLCSQRREGRIYDKQGEYQTTFGAGILVEAFYICIDSQDHLLVSDQEEHCVFVFDQTGQLLVEIGSYGDGDGELNTPKGIAVDCYDNIIVADERNDRVTVFDPHGTWCRHLVANDEELRLPHAVGYTAGQPSKMAVSSGRPGELLTVTVYDVTSCER